MKHIFKILWVFVFSLIVSLSFGQGNQTMAKFDEALKGVQQFEQGQNSDLLQVVEQEVVQYAKDKVWRKVVEERLIHALGTVQTVEGKRFICRQLRTIGTESSIPSLAALLPDPELSHAARYALGSMEYPAALSALHEALGKVDANIQAGIIYTLADKNCSAAISDIAGLLSSEDNRVAKASAAALGKLSGPVAEQALSKARQTASGDFLVDVDAALVHCADGFLAAGDKAFAAKIFQRFYADGKSTHLRMIGLRGLIDAEPAKAKERLIGALKDSDAEFKAGAINLARYSKSQGVTEALVEVLPTLPADDQVLMLQTLGARGDKKAAMSVVVLSASKNEKVRTAALEVLGTLGGPEAVGFLLRAAAANQGSARDAARLSLLKVEGESVHSRLVGQLSPDNEALCLEAIQALSGRDATEAVQPLLKLAQEPDSPVREAAVRAVGRLGGQPEIASLVALALESKSVSDVKAIEQAVGDLYRRVPSKSDQAAPVLEGLKKSEGGTTAMLLRLLGRVGSPEVLPAVQGGLKSTDADVRKSVIRVLSEWSDASPADDLFAVAQGSLDRTEKILALRGYVTLAAMTQNPTAAYAKAMDLAEGIDDKKMVLGGLGASGSAQALDLVEECMKDKALRDEAAIAALSIADRVRLSDEGRAKKTLRNIIATVEDRAIDERAVNILEEMEKYEGYILVWDVSGPYTQKGKDGSALFDIAFAPEDSKAQDAKWKKIDKGVGPWSITLDETFGGGDNQTGYLKTRVWSPEDQKVRMELGSDDGIKVWVNGELVLGKNQSRGLSARQDVVDVQLHKGWNDLMLKVTNIGAGWGVCCRLRKMEGGAVEGLRIATQ